MAGPEQIQESRLARLAPVVVGVLLVLEALALLLFGGFVAIIGGLAGALAFLGGAGSATDAQIAGAAAMVAITIAFPFVLAVVLLVGAFFVLLRRRRNVIVAAGLFAVAAQIAAHPFFDAGFQPAELIPGLLHVLAIAVAVAFVPVRPATAAPT